MPPQMIMSKEGLSTLKSTRSPGSGSFHHRLVSLLLLLVGIEGLHVQQPCLFFRVAVIVVLDGPVDFVGLAKVESHQVHPGVKTVADLALVPEQLFLVHAFDVNLQEAFVVHQLSTMRTFHIFAHFTSVQRQMVIQLFLGEKFLFFTSWAIEHLVGMLEHVFPKQMLGWKEV